MTLEHANIAECTIRTIESLLDKRMGDEPRILTKYLPQVLNWYNEKMVHSSIGMTPMEATKGSSEFDWLDINTTSHKKHPELKVGDKVRMYQKNRCSPRSGCSFGRTI
jgi:hypothetical protein